MRERPNRNEQTCRTPAVGDDLHLLFDVLRSGQSDFSAVRRRAGRFRDHTGGHRFHRLRSRPADSRRAGGHLRRRFRQTRQPGLPQIRLVPRRGDHAHHRPVLCDSAYGDHLIRNDGGSFRTVLLWLAGPTHLLARVLHTGVPVRPASRETLQSARPIHGTVAAGAHCCPVHRLPDPRHRHPGQPDGRLLHKPDRTRLPRRLPDHGPARRALLRHRDLREYSRPTSR